MDKKSYSTIEQYINDFPEETQNILKEIKNIIENVRKEVDDLIQQYEKGELKVLPGRTPKESLEALIKRIISASSNTVTDHAFIKFSEPGVAIFTSTLCEIRSEKNDRAKT